MAIDSAKKVSTVDFKVKVGQYRMSLYSTYVVSLIVRQELDINIICEDNKTTHHKVAACVVCVFSGKYARVTACAGQQNIISSKNIVCIALAIVHDGGGKELLLGKAETFVMGRLSLSTIEWNDFDTPFGWTAVCPFARGGFWRW